MRHHTKFLILSAAWVLLFVRFDLVLSFCFLRLSLMKSESSDWREDALELLIYLPPSPEHRDYKCATTLD